MLEALAESSGYPLYYAFDGAPPPRRSGARRGRPAGPLPALLPPGTWADGLRIDPVPALGQNSDSILGELGLDAMAIGAPRAAQAI